MMTEKSTSANGRFAGKIAIVTGASRNTGVAIARRFIDEGAFVYTSASSAESTENGARLLRESGRTAFSAVPCDISDYAQVKALFARVVAERGRVDILVNNACNQGIGPRFLDMEPDYFLNVIRTNLVGTFQMCREAARIMAEQECRGVIVNLGSNVSTRAIRNRTAYVASKGGIDALTRAIALDLGPLGIRVNEVAPGYIYTDRWDALPEEKRARRRLNCPLRREAKGDDIAGAVAFLASADSGNMTGERIVVDAGCSCQHMPEDVDI